VLAPFLYICPDIENRGLAYELFRAFLFRYLERFFCLDESSFLFKAFRLFHLLLEYFDPQLANYLYDYDFIPELYSPQWFLTLYARALPIKQVLRLWDMMIAVDDPSFIFFIGMCMLISRREKLLIADVSNIPEIIANLNFKSEEDIDQTVLDALNYYRATPRCILRQLRLCCVSTTELTPSPRLLAYKGNLFRSHLQEMRLNMEDHDLRLAQQSARFCLSITPQELVESMIPSNLDPTASGSANYVPQQYVILDVRSLEDSVTSGGGTLPRAVQLEPDFLNRPDSFDVWIQHFDGTRGCNLCIVDLPPSQWTGVALWRRLLLGEGDGMAANFLNQVSFDDSQENVRRLEGLLSGKRFFSGGRSIEEAFTGPVHEDEGSAYFQEEVATRQKDFNRAATLLAITLQTHAFSNVSVLEGGFPALVEYLISTRGTVEPIIINHDDKKWQQFLRSTGRLQDVPPKLKKTSIMANSSSSASTPWSPSKPNQGSPASGGTDELREIEIAISVASRLDHPHMLTILSDRLKQLVGSKASSET
jgi:hypothetical protein